MNKVILSICIPTYNRAEYIGEAIESILQQITPDIKDKVEICISDNASTDNTEKIVKKYQEKNICKIIYHKNEKNIGADRNFLKVIEIANGEYCWWLVSIDKLIPRSIDKILDEIKNNGSDIYLFNREEYPLDFSKKIADSNWFTLTKDKEFDFNKIEVADYLKYVNELGGIFSYISSIVFKKINWDKVKEKEKFIGTFYSHVYIMVNILKQKTKMKILLKPLVQCRLNNTKNTFGGMLGSYRRLYIDYYTIIIFIDIFGMDALEVNLVKKILLKQRNVKVLLAITTIIDKKDFVKLLLLLDNLGYKKEYYILKFFPKLILLFIKKIYKWFKGE